MLATCATRRHRDSLRQLPASQLGDEPMQGDNPLWYDCEDEAPQKKPSMRKSRAALVLALLAIATFAFWGLLYL